MATSSKITNLHKHHYVYRLTNLFPVGAERFYVGVRSCDCPPAKDDYWGSSIYLGDRSDFAKEILSVWKTREEAVTEEIRLHAELGVKDNPEYYNRSNQTSVGFDTTGMTFSMTEEARRNQSKAQKKLWEDPEYRERKTAINKEVANRPEELEKRGLQTKLCWENPAYRDPLSQKLKEVLNRPEIKEKISERLKQQWQDQEYRERMSTHNKEVANRQETKEKISIKSKQKWTDPEYREKITQSAKEQWNDPEYKEYMAQKSKERMNTPEAKKMYSEIMKERMNKPEMKEQLSTQLKERWQDPVYREKMSQLGKEQMSTPEAKKYYSEKGKARWQNSESRNAMIEAMKEGNIKRRKTYLLTDPQGTNYSFFGMNCEGGLVEFAKQRNLVATTLQLICTGAKVPVEGSKYFGWTGSVVEQ